MTEIIREIIDQELAHGAWLLSFMMYLLPGLTVLALYTMPAVPFLIWAGKASYRSAGAEIDGRPRGWPSLTATFYLLVLPAALILYYLVSGIGREEPSGTGFGMQREDEWRAVMFLCLPPCVGMISGYALGIVLHRWRDARA